MLLTLGSVVSYQYYNGHIGAAVIESIELCQPGEKYGKLVPQCDTAVNPEAVVCLSNHHWCYCNQIQQILSTPSNNETAS